MSYPAEQSLNLSPKSTSKPSPDIYPAEAKLRGWAGIMRVFAVLAFIGGLLIGMAGAAEGGDGALALFIGGLVFGGVGAAWWLLMGVLMHSAAELLRIQRKLANEPAWWGTTVK